MSEITIRDRYVYQIRNHNHMDNEQKTSRQPKGQTIIIKYSSWKKGQHFATVLQTTPGKKRKLIGRIYFERNGEDKQYVAKSADGKEVLYVSPTYADVEKNLKANGPALALAELDKDEAMSKAQTPAIEQPSVAQEQTPPVPEQKSPEDQLKELRDRGDKSKGITR